jgi:acetyl-CoA acetyltransferase
MISPVQIAGIGQVPLGRYKDVPLTDLAIAASRAALQDAGLTYDDVGEVYGSSMLGPPQTALQVAHGLGLTGVPVTGVESASAGGLVALREAVWAVRSGRCEVALAIGYEKTTALEPGGVVWAARTFWDRFPPQIQYGIEATRWMYDHECGVEPIASIAAKAWNNASGNPNALRRMDHEVSVEEVLASRLVVDPLTRMMCHSAADGAAAVVVTRSSLPRAISLLAIEQTSRPVYPSWPEEGTAVGPPYQTTRTAIMAFAQAKVAPKDVDVVSLHDMCTIEELTTVVALGLCVESEILDLALEGGLTQEGRLPTNTDGGCIARGHPIGATGLVQVAEVVMQLRGEAGERQVHEPEVGLVQSAGGGGSCVVAILRREA